MVDLELHFPHCSLQTIIAQRAFVAVEMGVIYNPYKMDKKLFEVSTLGSIASPVEVDHLNLDYVKERAKNYRLDIPTKLQLIEEMAEMLLIARKSYREKIRAKKS